MRSRYAASSAGSVAGQLGVPGLAEFLEVKARPLRSAPARSDPPAHSDPRWPALVRPPALIRARPPPPPARRLRPLARP